MTARAALLVLLLAPAAAWAQGQETLWRETLWREYPMPRSSFTPRAEASQLTPAPAESTFRMNEVGSALRDRTHSLLDSFQARQEGQDILLALPGDVLFDFDRSEIRPDARPVLDRLAELLRSYPRAPVDIQGHTDWMGSDSYNMALSTRRAQSVQAYLSRHGVPAARLHPRGMGEAHPVAPNARPDGSDDPEGRQRNRRVEFIIRPAP